MLNKQLHCCQYEWYHFGILPKGRNIEMKSKNSRLFTGVLLWGGEDQRNETGSLTDSPGGKPNYQK
jgi:hypothetical protein